MSGIIDLLGSTSLFLFCVGLLLFGVAPFLNTRKMIFRFAFWVFSFACDTYFVIAIVYPAYFWEVLVMVAFGMIFVFASFFAARKCR